MALNKVSLVSATNENTLAFASVKTDISLIKVEAPVEYKRLSAALTSNRRTAAEEGTAHQTARRLGVLFQDLLPQTPQLLRAYGCRSSEISEKSAGKADGLPTANIFANYLGPDVTSLWAAATSGAASIAAHLLACLLARMWPAAEAISIWVEIVAERKQQVTEQAGQGVYMTSLELLLVCKDGIPRQDLAEWDAGARAWLQVADEAEMRRQKQLELITKNTHIPVNTDGTTYSRVLDAWKSALTTMEELISGRPQRVVNGASLVGIASWHLYPDLLVLGESGVKPIRFQDKLVSDMGELTVGIENTNPRHRDGIFWSLPLSQLRYYGDPVVAVSHTQDNLHVSMDEFQFVVFGAATANWGSHYLDPVEVARFFQRLYEKLGPDGRNIPSLGWLQPLWHASKTLVTATGEELDNALAAVALGRRNGREFIAKKYDHPPPFFGIGHPFVSILLQQTPGHVDRRAVERMRFLALKLGLRPDEAIIRVQGHTMEYATAVPHSCRSFERLGPKHGRWTCRRWGLRPRDYRAQGHPLPGHSRLKAEPARKTDPNCRCHAMGHNCHRGQCPCIQKGTTCSESCHVSFRELSDDCPGCLQPSSLEASQIDPISNSLYGCANLPLWEFVVPLDFEPCSQIDPKQGWVSSLSLNLGIGLARPGVPRQPCIIRSCWDDQDSLCRCYFGNGPDNPKAVFRAIAGDPNGVALFVRVDIPERGLRKRLRDAVTEFARRGGGGSWKEQDKIPDEAEMRDVRGPTLRRFLERMAQQGSLLLPQISRDLTEQRIEVGNWVNSLKTFQAARSVYLSLSSATVSLRVINHPLHASRWAASLNKQDSGSRRILRQHRLACIAYFESGGYDMYLDDLFDVIAISTRNSLYISAMLLGDPFEAQDKADDIRHVIGNVGKTGIVLMVAPRAPKIRQPDLGMWKRVAHSRFDGSREDSFAATSLHLSFTDFEMPVNVGQRGSIDSGMHVRIVEAIISVYERAEWVADLDVVMLYRHLEEDEFVKSLKSPLPSPAGEHLCELNRPAPGPGDERRRQLPLTSIDNWEEFLNLPEDMGINHVGIVRSHANWIGRLATACVAAQKGIRTVILPQGNVCWGCCSCLTWRWPSMESDSHSEDGEQDGALDQRGPRSRGQDGCTTSRSDTDGDGSEDDDMDVVDDSEDVEDDEGEDFRDSSDTDSVGSSISLDVFFAAPHVFIC